MKEIKYESDKPINKIRYELWKLDEGRHALFSVVDTNFGVSRNWIATGDINNINLKIAKLSVLKLENRE